MWIDSSFYKSFDNIKSLTWIFQNKIKNLKNIDFIYTHLINPIQLQISFVPFTSIFFSFTLMYYVSVDAFRFVFVCIFTS